MKFSEVTDVDILSKKFIRKIIQESQIINQQYLCYNNGMPFEFETEVTTIFDDSSEGRIVLFITKNILQNSFLGCGVYCVNLSIESSSSKLNWGKELSTVSCILNGVIPEDLDVELTEEDYA